MEAITILQVFKHLNAQKKGQNLENVVAHWREDYEWDRPKVLGIIEAAKTEHLVNQVGKDNLRITDKGHELLESPIKSEDIEVKDQPFEGETNFDSDFVDFKKYVQAEVLSLKALLSKRTIAESEKNLKSSVDYEKNFILSLQE